MEAQNRGRGLGFMLAGTKISPRVVLTAFTLTSALTLSLSCQATTDYTHRATN